MSETSGDYLPRFTRWLRWRWHLLRWRDRDATWHAVHSYGCDACEAHDG